MSKTLSLQNFLHNCKKSLHNCYVTQANYDALAVPVNLKKKEIYQLTCLNLQSGRIFASI